MGALPRFYSLLLLCGLFLFSPHGRAASVVQKFTPGTYEQLMLAVDGEGNLSGVYCEIQGQGVEKRCMFFLKGKEVGGLAKIVSWGVASDAVYPGVLKVDGKDVILQINHGQDHPGCGLVLSPDIDTGVSLSRILESNWNSLKIIQASRANLFSEPSSGRKSKSYLIKGDVVGIVSISGEWVNIEFPRGGKSPIKGWIKSSDTKDLLPPQN